MGTEITFRPVVIIGAGRSGTNILRDTLVQFPDYATWPCDEINYIWRHGNMRHPTDELSPDTAGEPVQRFVRKAFASLARQTGVSNVVEKTCANSLRVGFVDRILPEARYIFIVRDGRDVVASAMKRWAAPLDLPYLLRKARYVPPSDLPYYGARYLSNRIYRLFSGEKRLAFWGPRFRGMEEMLGTRPLVEICAAQWRRCVERSEEDLSRIDGQRVHRVQYEYFVQNPQSEVERMANFLGVTLTAQQAVGLIQDVSVTSIGKWRKDLAATDLEKIEDSIRPLLYKYGYV